MPITQDKQERALLLKLIEILVDTPPKPVINHKNSEVQKKVSKIEEKTEKPKIAVCPPAPEKEPQTRRVRRHKCGRDSRKAGLSKFSARNHSMSNQQEATKSNAPVELPRELNEVEVKNHTSVSKGRG